MTTVTKELDGSNLKSFANRNRTFEIVTTYLALRERDRQVLNVDRIYSNLKKDGEKIVEQDYFDFWKGMDESGIGTYIKGRGINPNTFTSKYSLKTIAQAALTGTNVKPSQMIQNKEKKAVTKVPKKRGRKPGFKVVKKPNRHMVRTEQVLAIRLRPNFSVEVRLPQDLTPVEAKAMCRSLMGVTK